MSWLFSRVLVEEYLGDTSSDGEQSVQSSGSNIPQAFCAPDKMTDFSRLSRFGMTFKPLTESLGKALLMLFQEAFLAKIYQQRGGGAGIDGKRSGMWGEMARIIYEVQPRFVFVENSPMLTSRGLGRVLGDLASMGFDARWGVLGAADVGANHQRDRIWICAKWRGLLSHAQHDRIGWWEQQQKSLKTKNRKMANTDILGLDECQTKWNRIQEQQICENKFDNGSQIWGETNRCNQFGNEKLGVGFANKNWWKIEPNVGRVADGLADRVDRLKAIGNGQVPLCAATAWRILSESL